MYNWHLKWGAVLWDWALPLGNLIPSLGRHVRIELYDTQWASETCLVQEEIHHIGIGCIILLALSKRHECPSRLMTNIVCIPANGPVVFKFILGKMKTSSYLELKCSSPLHFGILKTLFFKTIGKKTLLCSLGLASSSSQVVFALVWQ